MLEIGKVPSSSCVSFALPSLPHRLETSSPPAPRPLSATKLLDFLPASKFACYLTYVSTWRQTPRAQAVVSWPSSHLFYWHHKNRHSIGKESTISKKASAHQERPLNKQISLGEVEKVSPCTAPLPLTGRQQRVLNCYLLCVLLIITL